MIYIDCESSSTSMSTVEWSLSDEYCKCSNSSVSDEYYKRFVNATTERLIHRTQSDFYDTAIGYSGGHTNNITTWASNSSTSAHYLTTPTTGNFIEWCAPKKTPADQLRAMIQSRQAPMFIRTHSALTMKISDREKRARDTLRRLVGESQYRKFLSHGFITARGKSGKIYQIKTGHKMTNVYTSIGQPIETLCVVLRGRFPPTDELITRFLMILNDEESFRALANVLRYHKPLSGNRSVDQRSLPTIFKSLKRQAA